MSVSSEVTRLSNAKASIKQSIKNKGVSVDDTAKIDEYASRIDLIAVADATIYVGSSAPTASVGVSGDLYIMI